MDAHRRSHVPRPSDGRAQGRDELTFGEQVGRDVDRPSAAAKTDARSSPIVVHPDLAAEAFSQQSPRLGAARRPLRGRLEPAPTRSTAPSSSVLPNRSTSASTSSGSGPRCRATRTWGYGATAAGMSDCTWYPVESSTGTTTAGTSPRAASASGSRGSATSRKHNSTGRPGRAARTASISRAVVADPAAEAVPCATARAGRSLLRPRHGIHGARRPRSPRSPPASADRAAPSRRASWRPVARRRTSRHAPVRRPPSEQRRPDTSGYGRRRPCVAPAGGAAHR